MQILSVQFPLSHVLEFRRSHSNINTTQGIALQCMRTYNMIQAIPTCEVFPTGSKLEELRFVKELVGGASLLPYSRKTIVLGKIVLQEFTDQEKRALDAFFPQCSSSCNQYQRVRSIIDNYI